MGVSISGLYVLDSLVACEMSVLSIAMAHPKQAIVNVISVRNTSFLTVLLLNNRIIISSVCLIFFPAHRAMVAHPMLR